MIEIFGFYKFTRINCLNKNKKFLQSFLVNNKIRGTLIISKEGINGTLSAKKKNLNISINKILRCCVNFTYNQSVKNCDFHVDHDFHL